MKLFFINTIFFIFPINWASVLMRSALIPLRCYLSSTKRKALKIPRTRVTIKYSQTCSSDNLYKTTPHLRRPTLSPPKQIPIQLYLYKTTTCLTRPATTFLSPKWKKSLSKTTTKNFIQQRTPEQTSGSMILFTLLLLYNAKFVQCLQKLDNL